MADSRTPVLVMLLRKPGNKADKLEIFRARDFWQHASRRKFRLRVNGRWFGETGKGAAFSFYSKWEIRDLLWRSFEL